MHNPTHHAASLMAAAGLLLGLATPGQAQSANEPAGQTVTVHRAAAVSSVSNGVESPVGPSPVQEGVTVVRGRGPVPGAAPVGGQQAARPGPLAVGAGDVVWLLDADDGRLIACELLYTADLGVRKFRCRARDWPD